MTPTKSTAKPFFELVGAGALWGFGFVASLWCLRQLSVPAILFYRFAGSALTGFVILKLQKMSFEQLRSEAFNALWPGFFLALNLILQTYGLRGTSATKSAFITSTYVVFVPLISHFLGLEKISLRHWFWVFAATLGGMLTLDHWPTDWRWAEVFTWLNALAASGHILIVGNKAKHSKSSLAFNSCQALYVCLICLPLGFLTAGVVSESSAVSSWSLWGLDSKSILGLASLTWGASFLAFLMQIRAQKFLSPSTASLLFLLESPFSFLFGFLLLGETLRSWQCVGAGLILVSCLGTLWPSRGTT